MPPKNTPKKDPPEPEQQPDLAAILAQLTVYVQSQSKTQEALLKQLSKPKDNEFLMETLSNTIPEFVYDPQGGLVFDKWYSRHEEAFTKGGEKLEDADRVRLLVRKLSPVDHDRYVNFILPRTPPDKMGFEPTRATQKPIRRNSGWPQPQANPFRWSWSSSVTSRSAELPSVPCATSPQCADSKFSEVT